MCLNRLSMLNPDGMAIEAATEEILNMKIMPKIYDDLIKEATERGLVWKN